MVRLVPVSLRNFHVEIEIILDLPVPVPVYFVIL